ncbi:filamentous hemagglutinin N-terminal domain-containing protein [Salmonella enterica]|nr:filamentous hemagglutinin N-terminal domain-containing protein [Salmonella enterica]ELW8336979.1 filamentous hemagglutinin N-terminal domain-containing protein [Salmonella enterica]
MNKIYKLKFDKRRNELVVVSEITAGMGKEKTTGQLADLTALSPFRKLLGTLTPLALLTGLIAGLLPAMVLANPDLPAGGQIVGGQGSISTSGNQMTIHQQTHNMATNWHSFDVGKNSTVQFVQPDSSSVALNRVTGAGGSQIMGTLKANGQVFILNPNGVLFGKDARVSVAGLVASTKNINTADFMKGQYTLSGEGQPGAQVVNQGSLTTAKGGYIVLAGGRVSNSGVIATPSGKTVLAAGKTVTLQLDNGGLTSVSVNGSVVNALVENRGLISATSGQVYLTAKGQDMLLNTVVNNSGTVEAKGLASRGGEIVLSGGDSGVVSQSGQLLADSQTGPGGKITLEGQNIHLAGGSLTSATGKTGGGEVYVGGGWQGKDSRIRNATRVVMDKTATADVSATDTGNGGTAVLWSDDYTNFRGTILAQGGSRSGNGGQVETSSHRILQASGAVDASARAGHGGAWLLDPADVTITDGSLAGAAGSGVSDVMADGTDVFTPTAGGAQILNTSIENQLNAGTSVTVRTRGADESGQKGNITLNADISKSAGGDAALTLAADGNITLNGKSITATTGKLDVTLLAAGSDSGRIQVVNSSVRSNGGNITLDQLDPSTTADDGSSVSNPNALTLQINGSTLDATAGSGSAGDILLHARNPNVNLCASAYIGTVRNGGTLTDLSGNTTLTGGNITLNAEQSGGNAKHLPWYLNHTTVNATGDILFSAQSTGGTNAANAEIRDTGNSLTAGGNITLSSELAGGSASGIWFNGSAPGAIQLTAGKNISLTGINPGSADGLNIKNTALSAGETLTLTGSATTGAGVRVTNSTLNAAQAVITGTSTSGSTGFALTGTTLGGGLADLANLTLSSAGSAASVVNILDSSAVNDANRDNLLAKRIENMTTVDMGGTAIFDDSTDTDKGWTHDYSLADLPNHGWLFSNTTLTSAGLVQLTGVGFSNATLNISGGGLNISQAGPLQLTNTTMNVNGDVLLHSDADLTLTGSRVNETSTGDATVSVTSGQNMSLSGTNITAGAGKLNITLLAGGSDSGRVQLSNRSTLTSNGGNIVIDQLNHTTTADDGSSISNPNALTVKVNNAVLNASAADATQTSGDILISAWQPNVNLAQSQYTNTVRNGGALTELSGNSALSGRDLVLHTTLEGGNAAGLPVFLNNATLTATRDITLSGTALPVTTSTTADDGTVSTKTTTPNVAAVELRGKGNVLTASGGNITIENQASGNNNGIYLNGNASGKAQLTALNGTITLNGGSGSGTGVLVSNSVLNASLAAITGRSDSGGGFSLMNSTLSGALADLANVTFSSAGSGAGVVNILDSGIVTDTSRDNLLAKRIENMTTVEMNGTAIFDDSAKTDKGWTHDYSSVDMPNGGWIFNNTSVMAGGDVNLKGAAFTNATVTVSNGSLMLDNGGAAPLTGSTLTVNDGAVSVHAGAGNIDLTNGNISAKGDISLKADAGSVIIAGTNATAKANITSAQGNISTEAYNPSTGRVTAVLLKNAQLSAEQGNININGTTQGTYSGVRFSNADLKANTGKGSINVYGESKGGQDTEDERGSVYFGGTDAFGAQKINITGRNNKNSYNSAGMVFDISSNVSFAGETSLNASAFGLGLVFWNAVDIYLSGGRASINGKTTGPGGSDSYYRTGAIATSGLSGNGRVRIHLNNIELNFNADSSSSTFGKVPAFGLNNPGSGNRVNGMTLLGDGDVHISGKSADGNAVDTRMFNNIDLNGPVSIEGQSKSGTGVVMAAQVNANLVNASITGISESGNGVVFDAKSGFADLGNNMINGTSNTGAGIQISGSNVTLSNGVLTGTVTSGSGAGVVLTGGNNYTLDGASVTGTSADGAGVAVNGTLTVNNGTAVEGHATGSGSGVLVSGNLATDSGDGISINGTAVSGDGIKVGGDTVLTNAMLTGHTDSGAGINVAGNLTTDNTTQVEGHAASGTGVNLGAALTGASVLGGSDTGAGVQLADNAVVTDASLSGTSTSGDGVAVTGNVTLDDRTAAALNASSVNGTGLRLADNADVSILNITTVTQEKKDADGNPVLDADGKPVTETVTTQKPVTTPVTLTGTSEHGTGIATEGNVSISGIVLNGNTSADGGTGVSLGGNLTIADAISGVTAGATGNGTALVVDNANIHSDGYTDSGKDFVINASVSGGGTAIKTQGSNQLGDVVLNGTASNGGTAVELGGQVSGADITGTSDSGTAVRVSDGAKIDGGVVQGHSDSGTGLNVSGNATLSNTGLSGTTQTGAGASVTGNLTADGTSTVTGEAAQDGGTGVTLAGTVTGGKLEGTSTSGDAVHIADGSVLGDAVVTGNATTGTGLNVSGNATLSNTGLSGTSQTGAGAAVSGSVTADDHSVVSGEATADGGTGVSVSGAVTGGKVTGTSMTGDAVHMADGAQINNAEISGTSQDGTAIRTEGQVSVSGSHLRGDSVNGSDLVVSGTLSHDTDTTIDAETVTGQENIQEVKPVTPPPAEGGDEGGKPEHNTDGDSDSSAGGSPSVPSEPGHDQRPGHSQNPEQGYPALLRKQAEVSSLRQGAANAQVTQMNRASQDGFHAAGSPPVPVSGYQPAEQTVDISLCDGSDCQSASLDAGRPAQGRAKTSGR